VPDSRLVLSVLIVDDHDAFRPFACRLLEADGFDVVATLAGGEHVAAVVAALHPDVVLLDVQMPGRSGFDVADDLARSARPPRVVLMSSRSAADFGARLGRSGAPAFLDKRDLCGASLAALAAGPDQPGRR